MKFSRIAIYRPVTTLMATLALVFLGVISYRELAVQRFPEITFPAMYYSVSYADSEALPEETNTDLTLPFEKMVAALQGVKEMRSNTGPNGFWGFATFDFGTDMRFRVIELQDQVNKWQLARPAGANSRIEARIVPQSTTDLAGQLMRIQLFVPLGREALIDRCTDLIRRKLKSIDGIAEVSISGNMLPSLVLETENDALQSAGLSVQTLVDTINKSAKDRSWLGDLREDNRRRDVYVETKIDKLRNLLAQPLDEAGVQPIAAFARPLRNVRRDEQAFRINGKQAVEIAISKEKERNAISMARQVRARVKEIEVQLPPGFELKIEEDQGQELQDLIRNIAKMALTGAVLAVFVLLAFVRNWRIALIVGISIPVSILITFNAMYAAGLSLNILTLIGLAAGIGMLVDNSIVVVENVFSHALRNPDAREAAVAGSSEVAKAILVSTATTLVAFSPILFFGELWVIVLRGMALSLVFPLLFSLLVALTLVPMLAAKVFSMRKPAPRAKQLFPADSWRVRFNPWQAANHPPRRIAKEFIMFCAKGSLRHPIRLFFFIFGFLAVTMLAASVKIAFQRMSQNRETRTVRLYGKAPLNNTFDETDALFRRAEKIVAEEMRRNPAIESFSTQFDRTGGMINLQIAKNFRDHYHSEFHVALSHFVWKDEQGAFQFDPFPQGQLQLANSLAQFQQEGGTESVVIVGENIVAMTRAAQEIEKLLKQSADIKSVFFQTPLGQPEVLFHADLELFRLMQVDPRQLQTFFRARDAEGVSTELVLEEDGVRRRVQVLVKKSLEERESENTKQTLVELKAMKLPMQNGGVVPLDHLGTFTVGNEIPQIAKHNRQRELNVTFNMEQKYYKPGMERLRQDLLTTVQLDLSKLRLPGGVTAHLGGTLDEVTDQARIWRKLMWLAILAVYLVMAFFFESLMSPLVILATLPLACIGGVWGMIAFNTQLDPIAMLGSIVLVGLVVNNGILLIDYTRQLRETHGFRKSRALLTAVANRFRPILMTSLTTILGLLPLLLSNEAEQQTQSLVAVMIGGIMVSTLLTLVIVPTFYNVMLVWGERLRNLKHMTRQSFLQNTGLTLRRIPAPALILGQSKTEAASDLRIAIRKLSKTYPVFRMRKLLYPIPSRMYPYGHRPLLGVNALNRISLTIESGMFGLLGPNGAGKTTLMKILTGIIPPTRGHIEICGQNLGLYRKEIRQYVSYLPQNFGVYGSLSLDQYLNVLAPYYGLNDLRQRRKKIEEVIEKVGLRDVRAVAMKRYSGGMRQRAGIAQFLLSPGPIIIVDEPTAGLDPVERVRFRLLLSELARTRIVILSTHIVDDITSSCQQIAVLNRGRIVYQGGLDQVVRQAEGLIWDLTRPAREKVAIPAKSVLFRKYVGEDLLYHYVAREPLPGSVAVPANFEDAYVALLLNQNGNNTKAVDAAAESIIVNSNGSN